MDFLTEITNSKHHGEMGVDEALQSALLREVELRKRIVELEDRLEAYRSWRSWSDDGQLPQERTLEKLLAASSGNQREEFYIARIKNFMNSKPNRLAQAIIQASDAKGLTLLKLPFVALKIVFSKKHR